ncbi:MAG: NTP transferase domain-containing protein [Deltaproteobacteria bacterium]|nr:NTP transferase domain-containing protein [Deltaproteobacteria bacterium]
MRAVILAGGKGTRLKPYTVLVPKPLVPVGGKYSILEIVIMQLEAAGFRHITLAVNHLANLIMAYFGDGSKWGVKLDYSLEDRPLSTIGPLTLIDDLPEDFLVMNGDILCNLNYSAFYEEHCSRGVEISVAAYRRSVNTDFGVLEYDESGYLTDFAEKPVYDFDVSMGIYCLNRRSVERLARGEPYGFDQLMIDGLKERRKIWVKKFSGYWLDIGRQDDYQKANEDFETIRDLLGIPE